MTVSASLKWKHVDVCCLLAHGFNKVTVNLLISSLRHLFLMWTSFPATSSKLLAAPGSQRLSLMTRLIPHMYAACAQEPYSLALTGGLHVIALEMADVVVTGCGYGSMQTGWLIKCIQNVSQVVFSVEDILPVRDFYSVTLIVIQLV